MERNHGCGTKLIKKDKVQGRNQMNRNHFFKKLKIDIRLGVSSILIKLYKCNFNQ